MSQEESAVDSLWEFVPLSEYRLPVAPAQSVASDLWKTVKRVFVRDQDPLTEPLQKERELHGLSQVQLAHLVPSLEWDHASAALEAQLRDWVADSDAPFNVRCLITPPYVDRANMLRQWAQRHDAQVLQAPDLEMVLQARSMVWPLADGHLWVIPDLERYFLRHSHGLGMVRDLLNHACAQHGKKILLGCDSWSWSYLRRVCRAPIVGALTLQAFDAGRLERLFCGMAEVDAGSRLCFLNAQNGHNIITVPDGSEGSRVELEHLAAHCRGNVGTAVNYWRESLRSTEQAPGPGSREDPDSDPDSGQLADSTHRIWVSSLLPDVTLPSGKDEDAFLLMHALLLHGGLDLAGLMQTLPMSPNRVEALVERMHQMGLLEERKAVWFIRSIAYAAVRDVLVSHNYLSDDF
ncbi:hypothetical protein [Orrella marina]|uniref:Uncharacterized protein n=1 Tax=Orrella marina TaxID=2163011 RepID=A0A2R4XMX4_9BURK|nr:hypothetical protein [Orrella marina]AWB35124.1 hypothetical protein DBV39_16875 [Orrella marina]